MTTPANKAVGNPMLTGAWKPVEQEVSVDCTEIEGTIPTDIRGSYLRNGPNQALPPIDPEMYHFFDGDGMIHQLELKDGKAHYRNRWVETNCLQQEREAGKALWKGFRSPPDFHHPTGIAMKHPANTHIIYHNNKLLALWEAGLPYAMDMETLETEGETDFGGEWKHAFTAHPTIDPRTGELITFYYSPVAAPYVKYGVIDKDGKVIHRTGIDLPKPVMIHDLAITPNYSIISDLPYVFSLDKAMAGEYPFAWEPENGARIGVIPRYGDGSEIKWFEVELGYILHVFNAYEEGDEVVFEACRSKLTTVVTDPNYQAKDEQGRYFQYRFNMKTGDVEEKLMDDLYVEFSRINEQYTGVYNRYNYCLRFRDGTTPSFDALIKYDRETGKKEMWPLGESVSSNEFVFAPRINSKSEDDGYYLGFIHDTETDKSQFLILDAQKFSEGPVATITIPKQVPLGFHASWVDAKEYET